MRSICHKCGRRYDMETIDTLYCSRCRIVTTTVTTSNKTEYVLLDGGMHNSLIKTYELLPKLGNESDRRLTIRKLNNCFIEYRLEIMTYDRQIYGAQYTKDMVLHPYITELQCIIMLVENIKREVM